MVMICRKSSEVVLRLPVYALRVDVGCEADQNRKVKVDYLI